MGWVFVPTLSFYPRQMTPIPNVNIASSEFKANPFPSYARLRSEAPVYRTILPDKRNAWLITRYQDVVVLLKDDRFSKDKMTAQKLPWMPGMFKPLMRNISTWMRPIIPGCAG